MILFYRSNGRKPRLEKEHAEWKARQAKLAEKEGDKSDAGSAASVKAEAGTSGAAPPAA